MSTTTDILILGQAVVDLEQAQVVRPDGSHPLSHLEVRLLRHLVEHRGRWVNRELLLRVVWEYAPRVVTRAVDNLVYRLRKKIEDDSATPRWITSRRTLGYRLEARRR